MPARRVSSHFCELYRQWRGRLDVVMRQEHKAGEAMYANYAGQTVGVVDRRSGEVRGAQIFVAVLGASNYTYRESRRLAGRLKQARLDSHSSHSRGDGSMIQRTKNGEHQPPATSDPTVEGDHFHPP